MNNKMFLVAALGALLFVGASCQQATSPDAIVGTWAGATDSYTFRSDGTGVYNKPSISATLPITWTGNGTTYSGTFVGSFPFTAVRAGNSLTVSSTGGTLVYTKQ